MSEPANQPISPSLTARVAARVAMVAGVFSLLMAALLVINFIQFTRSDPLNSPALVGLMEKMNKTPDDQALREQIRSLDLLARRAYFTSQNQLRTGAWLLLGGVVVFLIAAKLAGAGRTAAPKRPGCLGVDDPFVNAASARRTLIGGVVFAFAMVVFLGIMLKSNLTNVAMAPEKESEKRDSPSVEPTAAAWPTVTEMKANWPCFRGFDGLGVTERPNAPTRWDGETGENIRWKVKVPMPGYSSPIIWKNRLFLSGGTKEKRQVMAFDADTGAEVWRADARGIPGSPAIPPAVTEDTGYAAATMTTDGRRVFAIFATGDLICFTIDGERVWATNLGVPVNHYGHSSSLLCRDGLLIVQYEHSEAQRLMAFKAETGDIVWNVERGGDISWASPIIIETDGEKRIVAASSSIVAAHAFKDGKTLWFQECMSGEVASSPAYSGRLVFEGNEYGAAVALDAVTGEIKWRTDELDLPDVSSPVATEENVFFGTSTAFLLCASASTGENVWQKEMKNGFYASPILIGDRVFITDLKGVTFIFEAKGEYSEIARNKLGLDVVATPAFVGDRIYFRSLQHLVCVEENQGK